MLSQVFAWIALGQTNSSNLFFINSSGHQTSRVQGSKTDESQAK
jgi:hypothetical protein